MRLGQQGQKYSGAGGRRKAGAGGQAAAPLGVQISRPRSNTPLPLFVKSELLAARLTPLASL